MKLRILSLLLLLSISLVNSLTALGQRNGPGDSSSALNPPMPEKKAKITEIHGEKLLDHYFWLREKKNPAVIAHLEAENAYTDAVMKHTVGLQDKLYNEILSHIKQTDVNVPYKWGDYFYYTRTVEGQQYPIFCRKHKSLDAPEQVVIAGKPVSEYDPNVFLAAISAVLENADITKYDIVISESPYSPTVRRATAAMMMDLATHGVPIPPD